MKQIHYSERVIYQYKRLIKGIYKNKEEEFNAQQEILFKEYSGLPVWIHKEREEKGGLLYTRFYIIK